VRAGTRAERNLAPRRQDAEGRSRAGLLLSPRLGGSARGSSAGRGVRGTSGSPRSGGAGRDPGREESRAKTPRRRGPEPGRSASLSAPRRLCARILCGARCPGNVRFSAERGCGPRPGPRGISRQDAKTRRAGAGPVCSSLRASAALREDPLRGEVSGERQVLRGAGVRAETRAERDLAPRRQDAEGRSRAGLLLSPRLGGSARGSSAGRGVQGTSGSPRSGGAGRDPGREGSRAKTPRRRGPEPGRSAPLSAPRRLCARILCGARCPGNVRFSAERGCGPRPGPRGISRQDAKTRRAGAGPVCFSLRASAALREDPLRGEVSGERQVLRGAGVRAETRAERDLAPRRQDAEGRSWAGLLFSPRLGASARGSSG
jgi:hypothetical protein